jgi:hypothetical protein
LDKIFLNVLFNVNPENVDNPYKVVVERLLSINRSTPGKQSKRFQIGILKNESEKMVEKMAC